jgi:hypothetical protein
MAIFPNYQDTITAYTALNILKNKMPENDFSKAKVLYRNNQEILAINVPNLKVFYEICANLGASGSYQNHSEDQYILNLGAYFNPLSKSGMEDSNPNVREAKSGRFVILDLNSQEVIDPKHFIRHPIDAEIKTNTHFIKLTDVIAEMIKLQDTDTPIDHLRIVEILDGKIV